MHLVIWVSVGSTLVTSTVVSRLLLRQATSLKEWSEQMRWLLVSHLHLVLLRSLLR